MKYIFTIILTGIISACGQPVDITYHYDTPRYVLEQKAGYAVDAFAFRKPTMGVDDVTHANVRGHWECDIWLASRASFSSEDCWNKAIAHEERHCREGHFHPQTPEGSFVECNAQ